MLVFNNADFQAVALFRDAILMGGGIAAWSSPNGFSEAAKKFRLKNLDLKPKLEI